MNFIVYTPNYTHRSAGVRALHALAQRINDLGETCFVNGARKPGVTTPVLLDAAHLSRPLVAIYPEVVTGNPFGADVVVRWLLNKPGRANRDATHTWADTDIRACWISEYGGQVLRIPVVDREFFHNEGNPFEGRRTGCAVYSGKAEAHGMPVPDYGPNLCHIDIPPFWLGWLFRYFQKLYSCEESTITDEARACGCEVEYVLSDYLPKVPVRTEEPTEAQATAMVRDLIDRCNAPGIPILSNNPLSRLGWHDYAQA